MKYSVDSVKITLTEDETLVAGSVGVHYAEFTFDESWENYAKTAVFRNGNVTVEALVADGKCEIPWEVLADAGLLYVGIRGELGDKQRPTLWAARKTVHDGAERGDEAREPTPDIYQQLLAEIADIEEGKTPELRCEGKTVYWKYTHEGEEKWREIVTVVDGNDGVDGTDGKDGADGYTPVKGVDYFTEADKAEMVTAVLAALPNGDEVSY